MNLSTKKEKTSKKQEIKQLKSLVHVLEEKINSFVDKRKGVDFEEANDATSQPRLHSQSVTERPDSRRTRSLSAPNIKELNAGGFPKDPAKLDTAPAASRGKTQDPESKKPKKETAKRMDKTVEDLKQQMKVLQKQNDNLWLEMEKIKNLPNEIGDPIKKSTQGENGETIRDLQKHIVDLRNELKEMNTKFIVQQKSKSDLQTEIDRLQNSFAEILGDNQGFEEKLVTLQKNVEQILDQLDKAGKQVAFHVRMRKGGQTTTCVDTVICQEVVSNIGCGYDVKTGKFKAPVAGTYCFMATSSPRSSSLSDVAGLDLVVDDKVRGGLVAFGDNWSTCHTVLQLTPGQEVWLRSLDKQQTFAGEWWTTFTGMLQQPQLDRAMLSTR